MYKRQDYRYEIEGDSRNYDYEKDSLGSMGYQKQEFDEDSGELVESEEDDDLADDDLEMDADFEEYDKEEI